MALSTAPAQPLVRPVSRPGGRSELPPLRLTRRGRCGVATALVGAGLGASLFVGGISRAGTQAEAVPVRWVTVAPGDTLWAIAQEASPHTDPRDVVVRIRELNGLSDSGVLAGQRLAVPLR